MTGSPSVTNNQGGHRWLLRSLPIALCIALAAPQAFAGAREQAKQMYDRLAGVPPTNTVLNDMEQKILASDFAGAAAIAMQNDAFYSVTLKNFATPWTNREQSVFAPLNDYTATVIGMVHDDVNFSELLSGDIIYIGNGVSPAYSTTSNAHYEAMEQQALPLSTTLVRSTQSSVTGIPATATAGILTTRAAAKAFFIDGTNRAMFRFTMLNHLCHDMEQVKDITRTPDRIRQDVTRSPGGDSRVFLNACIGCHSGMDPMAQAFAYYNFQHDKEDETGENGQLVYHAGVVDPKYHINSGNFRYGFITPNDDWENYWRQGQNKVLGWDSGSTGKGAGAKSMGAELAHSDAFASCQGV